MDATKIVIEPSAIQSALRDETVLLDARKVGEFKKGHIAGALPLSTYEMLVNDTSIEGIREFAKSVADRFNAAGDVFEGDQDVQLGIGRLELLFPRPRVEAVPRIVLGCR